MDLFCEAFKPVFPFSLLFSLQLFRVLSSSSLFLSSQGQVSCVGLFSSIVYLVGLFSQFWGIFLKHFFDFTILFFQNSYCPDGGPSRLAPQFLFSLFHLFAFFSPTWKFFKFIFQRLCCIFHLCYIFNFQELVFPFRMFPLLKIRVFFYHFMDLFLSLKTLMIILEIVLRNSA